MTTTPSRRRAIACTIASLCAGSAFSQEPSATLAASTLPPVTVTGHYLNGVGTSDAASGGVVTARLIDSRPTLRPAEVLEFVPGVIVTQHSGAGKANQYFLRGFNLDHGTDFATWIDGMPVNMPTHAHGHGYSDMNWLIPELVSRIVYKKGPYDAQEGDFSSAGAARIELADRLPRGLASLTLGENRHARALVADSAGWAFGQLTYAIDAAHDDGPWENAQKFRRTSGLLRYVQGADGERWSLTAMAYGARWNATDQVPETAVDSGLVGRFGAIDPSDGGDTSRASLSFASRHSTPDGHWDASAYAVRSRLRLHSNFTYFLDDPLNGDQFEQFEQRRVLGASASRAWNMKLGGRDTGFTLGAQWRHDRLAPIGLYKTVQRERLATTKEDRVRQTHLGLHGDWATAWTPWLRTVAGLRTDRFGFEVQDQAGGASGKRSAGIVTPKLSIVLGPWAKTEFFVNAGHGFHSNDARGTVAAPPVSPLVRTRGWELGMRSEWIPSLQSSLVLWRLGLDSELRFVGDAGTTEENGASRRRGLEWNNHLVLRPWLLLDADLAVSQARFTQAPPGAGAVPGAVKTVASLGVTVTERGPWFGQFQLRHFGPRPLVEDGSRRSRGTTLAYLRTGYRLSRDKRLTLDVFNLLDRAASDIDYFYESRATPDGPAEETRHFHPVEPRSVRLTLSTHF